MAARYRDAAILRQGRLMGIPRLRGFRRQLRVLVDRSGTETDAGARGSEGQIVGKAKEESGKRSC